MLDDVWVVAMVGHLHCTMMSRVRSLYRKYPHWRVDLSNTLMNFSMRIVGSLKLFSFVFSCILCVLISCLLIETQVTSLRKRMHRTLVIFSYLISARLKNIRCVYSYFISLVYIYTEKKKTTTYKLKMGAARVGSLFLLLLIIQCEYSFISKYQ